MIHPNEDRDFGYHFFPDIVDYIEDHLRPEQVFTQEQLEEWARDEGFVKEDDTA